MPDEAAQASQPANKPRVAQETGSWQRLHIDGKVFYIVPATDVLQNASDKQVQGRYNGR